MLGKLLAIARTSRRHILALVGPVASAGLQLLLSILLLHIMDARDFGRLSFLLVLTQLSWGVWSALFCAPLSSLFKQGSLETRRLAQQRLFSANLIGAATATIVFVILALALGFAMLTAVLFAGYAAVALLRWYGRAQAYVEGRQLAVTRSDIGYALIVLLSPIAVRLYPQQPMLMVSATLLAAVLFAMAALSPRSLILQMRGFSLCAARGYGSIWHSHGQWALLGVVSTEATANAHAYLITLLRGPTAFAPIAASMILIRPLTIGTNALSEFERPRLAGIIADQDIGRTQRSVLFFRLLLGAVWLGTLLLAAAVMLLKPRLLFPAHYALEELALAGALWMIVGVARMVRTPDSILLQAAGSFRPLAMASVTSAVVSLISVSLLIVMAGPLWSILGIVAGEAVFAGMTWIQGRRWLHGWSRTVPLPSEREVAA